MADQTQGSGQNLRRRRQWRVGTFSMALMLIVFGVLLLMAQFKNFSAVDLVSTWWPVVLIVLGLEILAAIYFSGEDRPPLKYDVLSIFFVFILGIVTFGLYALTSTGVLPALEESFNSCSYNIQLDEQRVALGSEIQKIVVENSGVKLNVNESDADAVVAFADVNVRAISEEAAKQTVPKELMATHQVGNTLYIDIKDLSGMTTTRFQENPRGECTLVLPGGREVDVRDDSHYSVNLDVDTLRNDWNITTRNYVELSVAADSDLKLEVSARRINGDTLQVKQVEEEAGSMPQLTRQEDGSITFGDYGQYVGRAYVTYGAGNHSLQVTTDELTIYQK